MSNLNHKIIVYGVKKHYKWTSSKRINARKNVEYDLFNILNL